MDTCKECSLPVAMFAVVYVRYLLRLRFPAENLVQNFLSCELEMKTCRVRIVDSPLRRRASDIRISACPVFTMVYTRGR